MNSTTTERAHDKWQDRPDPSTRSDAQGKREERRPAQHRSRRPTPSLREAVEGYLKKREQKVQSDQLSRRTFNTDNRSLRLLLKWIETEYDSVLVTEAVDIGLREFKEFRLRSVSPTTVAKNLRHIKAFFSDLMRRDLIEANPAKRVDIPKSRRRDIIPTRSEFAALKAWLDEQISSHDPPKWIHLLMRLACSTGMRLGELIQIKWERGPEDTGTGHARNYVYLDSEEDHLTVKFKRKLRVIPIGQVRWIFDLLREQRAPGDVYVFASPSGGHYTDSYVCNRWKKEIKKVEALSRPYTCHCIRHAVVTALLRKNYSTHKVGKLVGHSSEQITERYAHLIATDLDDMMGDLAS